MELRHLRYFVAAAEEVHFARAAERLHVSAPAVGQQIKELEDELGVELFERLARGVRLTAAGVAFLPGAHRIMAELQGVVEYTQNVGRGSTGVLRVGHASMSMQRPRVGGLIPDFCMRYPRVEVRTSDLTTSEQFAALIDGKIDVGIVYAPPGAAGVLCSELLEEITLDGVLLPAAHQLARTTPLHCRDLALLPWLCPPTDANPENEAKFVSDMRDRGLALQPNKDRRISDPAVRISLVATGAGWMPATAASAKVLLTGVPGVVFCKWAGPPLRYPCSVVWRTEDRSMLVNNFVSFCREASARAQAAAVDRAKATRRALVRGSRSGKAALNRG
jgi:DNA-binding transcriptional LysR family regulator